MLARVGTFAALLKGDIGLTLESYVPLIVAALVARSILLILLISVRVFLAIFNTKITGSKLLGYLLFALG